MQGIRTQQFRGWMIILSGILLGGGVTLVYALALFAPLIELIKDIVGR